jgi:hypothetical protein
MKWEIDMLKPIETLSGTREIFNLSAQEIELQHEKLVEALSLSARDPKVAAIFAHGDDALRVIEVSQHNRKPAHWAVQTWSVFLQEWISQHDFPLHSKEKAVALARDWYQPMSHAEALSKWRDADNLALWDELFHSNDKLAEFLYDTKVIKWPDDNPWPMMTLIASTLIEFKGIFAPEFSFRHYAERYNIGVTELRGNVASIMAKLENKCVSR